jgi:uncharacterized membrane protein YpjA
MDDGLGILWLLVVAVFIGFIFGYMYGEDEMQAQAIQRGYALYCPSSGDFAWQGECE